MDEDLFERCSKMNPETAEKALPPSSDRESSLKPSSDVELPSTTSIAANSEQKHALRPAVAMPDLRLELQGSPEMRKSKYAKRTVRQQDYMEGYHDALAVAQSSTGMSTSSRSAEKAATAAQTMPSLPTQPSGPSGMPQKAPPTSDFASSSPSLACDTPESGNTPRTDTPHHIGPWSRSCALGRCASCAAKQYGISPGSKFGETTHTLHGFGTPYGSNSRSGMETRTGHHANVFKHAFNGADLAIHTIESSGASTTFYAQRRIVCTASARMNHECRFNAIHISGMMHINLDFPAQPEVVSAFLYYISIGDMIPFSGCTGTWLEFLVACMNFGDQWGNSEFQNEAADQLNSNMRAFLTTELPLVARALLQTYAKGGKPSVRRSLLEAAATRGAEILADPQCCSILSAYNQQPLHDLARETSDMALSVSGESPFAQHGHLGTYRGPFMGTGAGCMSQQLPSCDFSAHPSKDYTIRVENGDMARVFYTYRNTLEAAIPFFSQYSAPGIPSNDSHSFLTRDFSVETVQACLEHIHGIDFLSNTLGGNRLPFIMECEQLAIAWGVVSFRQSASWKFVSIARALPTTETRQLALCVSAISAEDCQYYPDVRDTVLIGASERIAALFMDGDSVKILQQHNGRPMQLLCLRQAIDNRITRGYALCPSSDPSPEYMTEHIWVTPSSNHHIPGGRGTSSRAYNPLNNFQARGVQQSPWLNATGYSGRPPYGRQQATKVSSAAPKYPFGEDTHN